MSETEINNLIERLEANWKSDTYRDHEAFHIAAEDPHYRIFKDENSCFNLIRKSGWKGEPVTLTQANYKAVLKTLLETSEDQGYPSDKPVTKWEKQHLANWLNEKDVTFDVSANKPELLKLVQEEIKKLEDPN